jgi:hypothetical protein
MDCPPEDEEEPKRPQDGSGNEGNEDQDAAYLRALRECEHHSIDQFDKTVLTLAAGAFAVSFAFLKDIVKPEIVTHKGWLIAAWVCWCLSLLFTLLSFFCSHHAMRHAQKKFKQRIRRERSLRGGAWGVAILWLNPSSGLAFIIGLIFMSMFVTTNLNNGKDAYNGAPPSGSGTNAPTTTNAIPATTTNAATTANAASTKAVAGR